MDAPQYTTCVDRKDYTNPDFGVEIALVVAALAGAILLALTGNLPAAAALLGFSFAVVIEALLRICDYELNGKLVCLGDEQCAIGWVTDFETVDDKDGFDKIDNDFCINLLLAPHALGEFTAIDAKLDYRWENYLKVAQDGIQGGLITEQADMPIPRSPPLPPDPKFPDTYNGYDTVFTAAAFGTSSIHNGYEKGSISVPVLHCEIEGDRLNAVCSVVNSFENIPLLNLICKFHIGGLHIGKYFCKIMSFLIDLFMGPIFLGALAAAWALGSDDNRAFRHADTLSPGDSIFIKGRWVYDAAHAGANELHPVLDIQRVFDPGVSDSTQVQSIHDVWCGLSSQALHMGSTTVPASGPQRQVYETLRQPEHRWLFHPELDGCQPAGPSDQTYAETPPTSPPPDYFIPR